MSANNQRICIISSHGPYGSTHVRDGIETLLVSASYDFKSSLLVLGEGILQLMKSQAAQTLPQKDTAAMIQAAELYDVDSIYACQEDLDQFGLSTDDLVLNTTVIARTEVSHLLQNFDRILNF